mmetsp:Transcript_13876/g.26944  ORF Transcript_13876/g.26944 Transcript_13876/m.26944 type:complete len:244 (-) Transcript_13876:109-840(-)
MPRKFSLASIKVMGSKDWPGRNWLRRRRSTKSCLTSGEVLRGRLSGRDEAVRGFTPPEEPRLSPRASSSPAAAEDAEDAEEGDSEDDAAEPEPSADAEEPEIGGLPMTSLTRASSTGTKPRRASFPEKELRRSSSETELSSLSPEPDEEEKARKEDTAERGEREEADARRATRGEERRALTELREAGRDRDPNEETEERGARLDKAKRREEAIVQKLRNHRQARKANAKVVAQRTETNRKGKK